MFDVVGDRLDVVILLIGLELPDRISKELCR
jgi:hypothetical protein